MPQPMSSTHLPDAVVNELLHSTAEAAIVTDEGGTIHFVNRAAEELFGYSADELVGNQGRPDPARK